MRFTLGGLFYVITAIAIYLTVDKATAFTAYNDSLGRLAIWTLIFVGLYLMHRRKRRAK